MTLIESVLRRQRGIAIAGLALVSIAAWAFVLSGSGTGMSIGAMSTWHFPPPMDRPAMAGAWPPTWWLLIVAMWWVMMVAMMIPSAAPLVLLYGRVLRHRAAQDAPAYAPSLFVLAGYLSAWLAFSLGAAALQEALQDADRISAMMLWSKSAELSATVLAAAGLYQLSPLKHACLAQCRSPAQFLARHWRPGRGGAFRLGALHGAYCVGCCWLLMALLFVGGVMNLLWIAALTAVVLLEKLSRSGERVGRVLGVILLGWAAATLLV
jgi:predicted metal-binding membrane protein